MITRRTMFGFALVPWAPLPKGITRLDVRRMLDIIQQVIDAHTPGPSRLN